MDVTYLIDVLGRIDNPTVDLLLNEATRPLVVRPTGMSADDFTHVIMPMTGRER